MFMDSSNANYYDNYVSDMNIFQLGQFASRQERDDVTYGVQLINCFPKIVGPIEYSAEANTVQTFNVTFGYRYWINYGTSTSTINNKLRNFVPTAMYCTCSYCRYFLQVLEILK